MDQAARIEAGTLSRRISERLKLSGIRCLTCGCPVQNPSVLPGPNPKSRTVRTRGHLLPRYLRSPDRFPYWLVQCQECNSYQGEATFFVALSRMAYERDPRAQVAFRTLMILLELGVDVSDIAGGRGWRRRIPCVFRRYDPAIGRCIRLPTPPGHQQL